MKSIASVDNFDELTARLDEIVDTVRSKDTSLERSLDLFDEAIALGSKAVDMVDKFELSPSEAEKLQEEYAKGDSDGTEAAPEGHDASMVDVGEPGDSE